MTSAYDTLILGESGLQAYYPLNETSGTTANDLTANAYNGTITGGVTLGVASLLGNDTETAMTFNGSTGYIALPAGLTGVGWTAFTLEAWCSLAAVGGYVIGNTTQGGTGLELFNASGSPTTGWAGNLGNAGGNGGAYANTGFTPFTSTVYHVALVYDGAHVTVFLNGSQIGAQESLTGALTASGNNFNIGRCPNSTLYLNGTIQKVAVYNTALSATKLQAHTIAGARTVSTIYPTQVVADGATRYYRLNDAVSSTTAADSSSNAVTATVNSTSHVVFGNAGIVSGADTTASFDGSGLISTTSQTGLPTSGGHSAASLEAWLSFTTTAVQVPVALGAANTNGQTLYIAVGGGVAQLWVSDGPGVNTNPAAVKLGTYYHVVVTYDGATTVKFYLSGVLLATLTLGGAITWTYLTNSLTMGQEPNASFPYTGLISEVAVYTAALSGATVLQHYLAALGSWSNIVNGSPTPQANSVVSAAPAGVGPHSVAAQANATFSASGGVLTPSGAPTYSVLLGGVAVNVIAGTLDLTNQIGQRSQGRVSCWSAAGVSYDYGTSVSVVDQLGNTVYTGFVVEDAITLGGYTPRLMQHDLTIVDNHYLADKRLASASFLNETAGVIVKALWQSYLAVEGVTLGPIANGVWVPEYVVNYEPVSSQLDKLAAMSGYWWQIDEQRQLWFQPYGAQPGPYTIDGSTVDQNQGITVTVGNKDYRNRQFGVGGRNHTNVLTENFIGDGKRRTWTLRYPVSSLSGHDPKSGLTKGIYLNGVLQTNVANKSEGTNTEWGYAVSDAVIAQWDSYTVLTSSDNLQVIYEGEYPVVALAQNKAQIASQRVKENIGTGYVEARYANLKIHTLEAMFAVAQAQLGYYGQTMTKLEFSTRTPGLAQGQTVTVNLPDYTLNNDAMLIESVEITDSVDGINIWYHVTAVGSPYSVAQWQTFWQNLLNQDHAADTDADNQNAGTAVAEVNQTQATWNWTATTSKTVVTCHLCGPATLCSGSLLVC